MSATDAEIIGFAPVCPGCRSHMRVLFRVILGPSPEDVHPSFAVCETCELGWNKNTGTFDLDDTETGGSA